MVDCLKKIKNEMEGSIDKHSKILISSNIELFLNYCARFYDRQFVSRELSNKGVLEKLEKLVDDYFATDKPQTLGQPTVTYFAKELNYSPNYFGDLIKRELGITPQEYIHSKVIDIAKERIFDVNKSISEIAYDLGFKYPQHFTRLFKQKVGVSPLMYRNSN